MSLYYLILWNQVDILQKHFKKIMSIYASGRGVMVHCLPKLLLLPVGGTVGRRIGQV